MEYWGLLKDISCKDLRYLKVVAGVVDLAEMQWARGHRVLYFEAMFQICWRLHRLDADDRASARTRRPVPNRLLLPFDLQVDDREARRDLLRKCVESVFAKEPATPFEVELDLMPFLTANSSNIKKVASDVWSKQRTRDARLVLRLWGRLVAAQDPDSDPKQILFYEDESPPLRDPNWRKDPQLRRKYEEARARNKRRYKEYAAKAKPRDMLKLFVHQHERHIVDFYSTPPYNTDELKAYMDEYGLDDETKARILKKVAEETPAGAAEKPDTF